MEEYRKKLQKKFRITAVFCCLSISIFIVLQWLVSDTDDFITGLMSGAFAGMCVVMIFNIARYYRVLKDDELLKKMYIAETDERNIAITKETMKTASTVSIMVTALAVIVSGFFHPVVSITLAAALLFDVIITIVIQIYYQKKL